jgi:hypothetical protein
MDMSNRHASILLTSAKAPSVTQLPGPARFCHLHSTPHFCRAILSLVGWHASLQGSDPSRDREISTTSLWAATSAPSHNVYHCRYAWQGAPQQGKPVRQR